MTIVVGWIEPVGSRTYVLPYASQRMLGEERPTRLPDGSLQRLAYVEDNNLPVRVVQELCTLSGFGLVTELVEINLHAHLTAAKS